MAALYRGLWLKSLCLLSFIYGSLVFAASINDQFEVARTKLFYLLAQQELVAAVTYIEEQEAHFNSTQFDQDWSYLSAITYSNSGGLEKALVKFNQLEAAAYTSDNFLLEYGFLLIKKKEYSQAIEKLNRWSEKNPTFAQAEYYLGLSHYELNHFSDADAHLSRLVEEYSRFNRPGVSEDRVLYLYSATKAALGQYSMAEEALVRLSQWPGGSVYQDSAFVLLESIRDTANAQKPFNAKLSLIGSLDSNVTLASAPEGWDARGAVQGDFNLNLLEPLSMSYQVFASRHVDQSTYNLTSHTVDIGTEFKSIDYSPAISYEGAFNFLDGNSWLNKHSLVLAFSAKDIDWSASTAYLQYDESDDELDFLFTGRWQMPEPPNVVQTLTFEGGIDWTTDVDLATQNIGFFGEVEAIKFNGPYVFVGRTRLGQSFYAPSIEQESAFLVSATGSVKRNWSAQWASTLKADGFASVAQPDSYGYNRLVVTATTSWRY